MASSFIERLSGIALRFPERPALEEIDGSTATYSQLWTRACETARILRAAGVRRGDTVALRLPRSIDFIVGFVAVWLAEAVAWPLDPALPPARVERLLDQASPVLVLSRERMTGRVVVSPAGSAADAIPTPRPPEIDPQSAAYLIYTSGSSGEPKGVLVSHQGLVPMLEAQIAFFQITETSRCFWMHGLGFDASISDFGTALLAGACLCFAKDEGIGRDPEALHRCLQSGRITHADLPPSLLPYLKSPLESLQTLIIGGEVGAPAAVRKWAARCRVVSVYGPTEATICTHLARCDERWNRPLLGDALPGVRCRVCDETGHAVPAGTPGELWIEGACVALGYPFQPELERERFDFSGSHRLYRTGDIVVQHGEELEFLGREDRQFKSHGKLICPEEVEQTLGRHPAVRRAYTFSTPAGAVATCVETHGIGSEEIREHAAVRLPSWMIPSRWIMVDNMPSLPNGKPDAAAINALLDNAAGFVDTIDGAALSSQEEAIASLFRETLGLKHASRNDDFFDLGGDSLAAMAFLARANERGMNISADIVYRGRTVAGIATLLGNNATEAMDAAALNRKVEAAWQQLESLPVSLALAPVPPVATLLTGAAGFLGSAVLGEWLQQTDGPIFCLVRTAEAGRRALEGLSRHGFPEPEAGRCRFLVGDAGAARLGLPRHEWESLAETVNTVVHLAADLRLMCPFPALRQTNVGGCQRIIEFCLTGRSKRLHAASTLSVFVDADPVPAICLEEDQRREVSCVHGGYAQTKWGGGAASFPRARAARGCQHPSTGWGF